MESDVIVIGAGLAGLQCARRVQRSGYGVVVLESADAVGGRIRTENIDGFLCDRGFQLLNPAYPAVRSWIDVDSLGLQKFGAGVVVRSGDTATTLAHPLKHPQHALETLRSELTPASELLALARWLAPAFLPLRSRGRDESLHDSFDAAGLKGRLRRDVLDPFLSGVLASSRGESSAHYVRDLVRYFALGTPGLPRAGMQALPEQLASWLLEPVRLNTAARQVRQNSGGVSVLTDHGEVRGRAAVIAVGGHDLPQVTELPAVKSNGLTTWWFRAPHEVAESPFIMLDATAPGQGAAGPIWHTAVVSSAAPSYAPRGEILVEATTLLDRPDGLAEEGQLRRQLARLYKTSPSGWEVLAHHVVPHTLPEQLPPLKDRQPLWTGERILLAGDHRHTASIQGALASGDSSGREVVQRLKQ
ncbi:flavin monoamine oxidase family protein [Specibacter sp. NPDC057265]|uniref:flavin monoamine oxidase family protein n=1 Tax=Specibacter sp. NPDC057265 TaxID=3346075 RepID=UPI0036300F9B